MTSGIRSGGVPRRRTLIGQERRFGYTLIAPTIVVLLAITGYPLVYNIWNSFHDHNLVQPESIGQWAGVGQYRKIFTDDRFVPALEHTLGFTVVSVVVELVVGMALALALNQNFRGRSAVRAAVFIPWAVPTIVSAQLWKSMFDPQAGVVNYLLGELHLPGAHTTWLDQTWTAWTALLIADAWKYIPFMAILLLAGLQVIPQDIYEAARIDGAGSLQQFFRLTLPLLKPALMVALIFRTLSAFLVFDVIYIMTGGGPGNATQTLAFVDFNSFIVNFDFGYGGAVSVALVLMALVFAGAIVRAFRTDTQL